MTTTVHQITHKRDKQLKSITRFFLDNKEVGSIIKLAKHGSHCAPLDLTANRLARYVTNVEHDSATYSWTTSYQDAFQRTRDQLIKHYGTDQKASQEIQPE